jgi:flagellar biosynthesis/type III secretory pathway M-ring protein FliF/YscJ
MSDKKLSVLGILAVVSIVLALAVSKYVNKSKPVTPGMGVLIQGLDPASVHKITVKQGGNTVTLNRDEDEFAIEEKDDYPAAMKVVNNLFT